MRKDRFNILIACGWSYPDSMGGSQRVIYETARGLAKRGHRVTVLTARENGSLPEEEAREGFRVVRYEVRRRSRFAFYLTSLLNSYRAARRLGRREGFQVLSLHHPLSAWGASLAGSLRRTWKVYNFYGLGAAEYGAKARREWEEATGPLRVLRAWEREVVPLFLRLVEGSALRRADRIIVLSEYSRKLLRRAYGIPAGRIEIIPPGVAGEKFRPPRSRREARKKLGLKEDLILLSVRRLDYRMGLENLLVAFSQLVTKRPELFLLIVGDGPRKEKLEEMARDLGIEKRVRFPGFVEEDELPLYYQAARLFVLPTESQEGFGLAALEALASGVPVVGTPIGAIPGLLRPLGKDLLFAGTDPDSLASLLSRHITQRTRLSSLGREARQYAVSNYHWERFVEGMEKTFRRRTRVLTLITALHMGGAERMLLGLVEKLKGERYEFLVSCLRNDGLIAAEMRKRGIRVVDLNVRKGWELIALGKLIRMLRKEKIDLVHTHLAGADIVGALGAGVSGVPVISTRHNTYERWQGSFLLSFLYSKILASAAMIVAVSEAVKSYLVDWGRIPAERILVIPNGIDPGEFHPGGDGLVQKKALGFARNSRVVGTVGRLDALKGGEYFLRAARHISDSRPGTSFLIVGDGPERRKLQRKAKQLGLGERVIFTGWREDIPELLAAMDIFVLPSRREGLGLAALEAMGCARPVVASRVDGLRELVTEGENGLLVRPGDVAELTDAILLLLRDKELARKMGARGCERVKERYDLADCARRVGKLYRDLAREKR